MKGLISLKKNSGPCVLTLAVVFFHLFNIVASIPTILQIGVTAPIYTPQNTVLQPGVQSLAAVLMALSEVNNKSDGLLDNILPSTMLKIAFETARGDFLLGLRAGFFFSESAFNNTGVVSVIGPGANGASISTGQLFAATNPKIAQIAYGSAQSSQLSYATYAYYQRTCPTDAVEGQIIARVVRNVFDWRKVSVFFSGDTFGNDANLQFEKEASVCGITIESKFTFVAGSPDLSLPIDQALHSDGISKIFILLMPSIDAGRLIEQGYKLGLFKEGVQIIGTEYLINPATWEAMSPSANIPQLMKGVLGVIPTTIKNRRDNPHFKGFAKRFLSQKSTQKKLPDGSIYCDSTRDDDGRGFYFMGHMDGLSSSPLTCTGIDYSTFPSDGSTIHDNALYAYDAAIAMAKALHQVYHVDGRTGRVPGDVIKQAILNLPAFDGVSGGISFDKGDDAGYGEGDRGTLMDYALVNFDSASYHPAVNFGAGALKTVGVWTKEGVYVSSSSIVFNTADNSTPVDVSPVVEVEMSGAARTGLRAAAGIALTLIVFVSMVLVAFRDHRIVKATQPMLMQIVLFGGVIACVRVILTTLDITDGLCVAGKLLAHLSFAIVFGALIMKVWRVNAVVNSGFKRVTVSARQVQLMFLIGLSVFMVYLVIDIIFWLPHRSYEEYFDGHSTVRLIKCTSKNSDVTTGLFVIEGLVLLVGARLCWSTKDAPGAVNDARFVAMAMYLILFVCSVIFPIVYLNIKPTPSLLVIIMSAGFVAATVGTTVVVFGGKVSLLLDGADVDNNFEIVRSASGNNKPSLMSRAVSSMQGKAGSMRSMAVVTVVQVREFRSVAASNNGNSPGLRREFEA